MKKIVFFLFFCVFGQVSAQKCTTSWPYLFPEFEKASVYLNDGRELKQDVNIHVRKSTLHFLDGDIVKEVEDGKILRAEVGDRVFLCVDGKMIEALKVIGSNFVGSLVLGDFDKLNRASGAYGTASNTSAAHRAASIELGTSAATYVNYTILKNSKNEGSSLPLTQKYCLIIDGKLYMANRRAIESGLSKERKDTFKAFLKTHKIQWKNPESLVQVLDFLNQ